MMNAALSIRTKLIVIFTISLLIVFLALSIASHTSISSVANQLLEASSESQGRVTHETLNGIQGRMSLYADALTRRADLASAMQSRDTAALREIAVKEFAAIHKLDATLNTLELTDASGVVIMRGHNPDKAGDNKKDNPMVKKSLAGERAAGLTVSPATGEMAQDAVAPIRVGNTIVGTVKAGSYLRDDTAAALKNIVGNDVVFVVNGKVNASTLPSLKELPLPATIADKLKAGQVIVGESAIGGVDHSLAYVPMMSENGTLGAVVVVLQSHSVEERAVAKARIVTGITAFVVLSIMIFVLTLFANSLIRPIRLISGAMNDCAHSGDLTRTVLVENRDECGMIAASYNKMLEQFRTLAGDIAQSSRELSRDADSLGSTMAQVNAAAGAQTEAAATVASSIEQMTVSIHSVTDSIGEASASSNQASQRSNEGRKIASRTSAELVKTAEIVRQAAVSVNSLSERSTQVGSIVQVIKEIADQTSLLALNAAIEAARAGEQGRGFAVVADEVRKLADRTTSATKEIAQVLDGISADIAGTATSIDQSSTQQEANSQAIGEVTQVLDAIADDNTKTAAQLHEVESAAREQAVAADIIAQATEQVAQKADESASAVDNAMKKVDALVAIVRRLDESIARFKT